MEELQGSPGLPQRFYSHPRMSQILRLSETILGLLYSYVYKSILRIWDTLAYSGLSWDSYSILADISDYIIIYIDIGFHNCPRFQDCYVHYIVVTWARVVYLIYVYTQSTTAEGVIFLTYQVNHECPCYNYYVCNT